MPRLDDRRRGVEPPAPHAGAMQTTGSTHAPDVGPAPARLGAGQPPSAAAAISTRRRPGRLDQPSRATPAIAAPPSPRGTAPAPASALAPAPRVNMRTLASNLIDLQRDLHAAQRRPVDRTAAAEVVNALRRFGLAEGMRLHSNADLAALVTDHLEKRWNQAQGLGEADFETMTKAAFVSGLANPTGGDLSVALSYVAAPLASALSGTPVAGLAVGVGAAIAAPFMNAKFQSGVVTRCEVYRERAGPTIVLPKNDINDKVSLEDAARVLTDRARAFQYACEDFERSADGDANRAQRADAVLATCESLCEAQRQALMTQGSHARQRVGNAWQIGPRTMRPIGAGAPAFGTGLDASATLAPGQRRAVYSPLTGVGIQSGMALGIAAAHHLAAGFDERNKQIYNNKLNMLYADVATPAGQQRLRRGEPIGAEDIDEAKLRKLVQSPAQAFVARVMSAIQAQKTAVASQIQNHEAELDPERGVAIPATRAAAVTRTLGELGATSRRLEQDLELLRAGRLDELPPDGEARGLIERSLGTFASPLLGAAVKQKYDTPGETSAQTIQRLGQAFHLGIFGSAAASVAARVSAVATGGSAYATNAQVAGMTAASGAMAFVGARFQHAAISEKNHRRANPGTVTASQQFLRGARAAIREPRGNQATSAAVADADRRIRQAAQTIALAREAHVLLADASAEPDLAARRT